MTSSQPDQDKTHAISSLAAWAMSFGCAVGWGSFVMPGRTFLPKAGPAGTVIGVLIGGLIMAVIAWNYHTMMKHHPGPGGAYAYAREAFGIDHGFLCAWFLGLTYMGIVWANATALAIVAHHVFDDYLKFGFSYSIAEYEICLGDILLAVVVIAIGAAACCRRRVAAIVQTVAAIGFAAGIIICFISVLSSHRGGLAAITPAFAQDGSRPAWQVLRIVALSPWLFVGFEGISHISGEFKFPVRRSFMVMIAALAVSVMAYVMLAVLPALAPGAAKTTGISTFDAVSSVLGRRGIAVMGVTMFGAILTGVVGNIFTTGRLLAAMADDGILSRWFGRRNSEGSPQNAILAVSAVSLLVPFLGRTAIGFIVDVSTIGAAIAYAYTSAAAWTLAGDDRRTHFAGTCGVILSFAVVALFIIPNYASGTMMATESYLLLVLWCIVGFIFFRHVFRRDKVQRFGQSTVVWVAILVIIMTMSLMWMRQTTSDTTQRTFDNLAALHDTVLPAHPDLESNPWHNGIDRLRNEMNASLLRGGLVQTGLVALAFVIMFNLYSTLRRRERELEREKTLRQRERDIEREKSKARSYFFSTVSHDIRTPLNAIIGFSEMLKAGFPTEEERQQAIDSIILSGQTLLGLINDVLDLSKLESGKMVITPEPIDCRKLLLGILDAFRVAGSKPGLELRFGVDEMPILQLDPQRLRQIVFNLVGNAVKFTQRGYIELRASFTPDAGGATGTFRVEVEDTGCGISEEDLKKIASAYVQVGSKISRNGGTGLGLAICKQLAAAMGGELSVASELGRGSTFSVTLRGVAAGQGAPDAQGREGLAPSCQAGQAQSPAPQLEQGGPSGRPGPARRILIVDDSKMNRMVLQALLKKEGPFEVAMASDGNEALAALEASPGNQFDLVLTDMWMPNLDGQGLLKAIRERPGLAKLRVIAVTADVEFRGRAQEVGFDGMLLKPITSAALSAFFKGEGAF